MIGTILALYDFGSKQEYIYRTSKIKEISGASVLLAGMYREFNSILQLQEPKIELKYTVDEPFELSAFVNGAGKPDGEVLYDGGIDHGAAHSAEIYCYLVRLLMGKCGLNSLF